jgi:hypothetical protein
MKKYQVYGVNKSWKVATLERAIAFAQRESKVGYRMSVFEDNKKIATYQFGEKIF